MKKKIDPIKIFLNMIIVVLCIVFAAVSSQVWEDVYFHRSYHKRANQAYDYESCLKDRNYVKMYGMAKKNEISDDAVYVDVSEFEALGKYFEQAFHYRMYCELGDSEKAAKYEMGMKNEAGNVKTPFFQSELEKINDMILE